MLADSTQLPLLSRPSPVAMRMPLALFAAGGACLVFCAAWFRPSLTLNNVVAESGLIDPSQPWIWGLTGLFAAFGCARSAVRRDTLFFFWMGMLATLAGLRELDLHVLINPSNIHLLGLEPEHAVRFRSRWWLSIETPILVRIAWLALFLVGAGVLFAPFIAARVRWKKLALARDPFAWSFGVAFAFLAGGYLIDDILLRLADAPPSSVKQIEELSELIGQFVLIAAIVLAIRKGPYERARPLFGHPI